MNHDTHIKNIISQTSAMVFEDFSRAVNVTGRLDLKDIQDKIRLAVECGRAIGYEQARYEMTRRPVKINSRPIIRMDARMNERERYKSIKEAARDVKVDPKGIRKALKNGWYSGGYKWKYA